MLLRQLEYFVAVARERHFARAAEVCYVSQPALSTAIAKLERELDVTLIHRGQNFEGLTLEGERLVVWAKRLLAEHDGLKAEAAALRTGISGTLRLGTGPTVSTTTAIPVAAFCNLHPKANVSISSRLSSAELLRQLRDFELDAAIAHFGPEDRAGLEGGAVVQGAVRAAGLRRSAGTRYARHHVVRRRAVAAGAARAAHAVPAVHRQGLRRERRDAVAAGRNGFGGIAVCPGGHRRLGERRAPHVAAGRPQLGAARAVRLIEPETTAQISLAIHAGRGSAAARAFVNVAAGARLDDQFDLQSEHWLLK